MGYTLLELVIVIAIVAILAGIAYPSYIAYITRSNRNDAMVALQKLSNEQEQHYLSNNTYANDVADLPIDPLTTEGYYLLGVISADTTNFVIEANPSGAGTTGRQAADGRFRFTSTGVKTWDAHNDGSFSCNWTNASKAADC